MSINGRSNGDGKQRFLSGHSGTSSGGYTTFDATTMIASSKKAVASRSNAIISNNKPFLVLLVLLFISLAINFAIVFLWFHNSHEYDDHVHLRVVDALENNSGKQVASSSVTSSSEGVVVVQSPVNAVKEIENIEVKRITSDRQLPIESRAATRHIVHHPILNAVIHIGPYTTDTTSIQLHSQNLIKQLSQDNYEMPWSHLQHKLQSQKKKLVVKNDKNENVSVLPWWSKQMYFALCFFQNVPESRSYQESDKLCVHDLLDAGVQIAKVDKKSVLISAEQFSNAQTEGVLALHDYLSVNQFENVTIVATYRRYYEWIASFHHDRYKDVNLYDTIVSSVDKNDISLQQHQRRRLIPSLYHELQFNPLFQEELHHKYTLPTVSRFRTIFTSTTTAAATTTKNDNTINDKDTNNAVVVMNYHDQNKAISEQFYCDVVPHADKTCESVKKAAKKVSSSLNTDIIHGRVYEELVFGAHQLGLVKLSGHADAKNVVDAIGTFHAKSLNGENDFPRKCLPKEMLDDIWEISLQAEKEFGTGDSKNSSANVISGMKDEFDKYSKSTFCEVDVDTILALPEWIKFFKELRVRVPIQQDKPVQHKPGTGKGTGVNQKKDKDLNYEVNDHSHEAPHTTHAVIHIGPYKTGTTAIQQYSVELVHELAKDNYEMPWAYLKKKLTLQRQRGKEFVPPWWSKQMYFALCFFQGVPETRSRSENATDCRHELLDSGNEIADINKNSLLISAEQFSNTELEGVSSLHQYVSNRWDNVTIVATYRRYFEWIVSFYNEKYRGLKIVKIVHANNTNRLYPSIYEELLSDQFQDEIKHKYTLAAVARFKQYFPDVVVLNYHDKSKRLVERFYCDVIPDASNTCKKMKKLKVNESVNKSIKRVYQELAYAAHRKGLINISTHEKVAESSIQQYQEKKLNLTADDFPHRCLPKDVLDEIWNITLKAEREFGSPVDDLTIQSLRYDFDNYSKTQLCEIDLEAVLASQHWIEFFTILNSKLRSNNKVVREKSSAVVTSGLINESERRRQMLRQSGVYDKNPKDQNSDESHLIE
jgi:hypothetical protein